MESVFLSQWSAPVEGCGFLWPRLWGVLHSRFVLLGLGAVFAAVTASAVAYEAWDFLWLLPLAMLSFVLIRRDPYAAYFLLGVSWALSLKLPLPWPGLAYVLVRLDDVLTLLLLWTVLRQKALPPPRNPLARPILIFLVCALLSMIAGLFRHAVGGPLSSLLNLAKWGQYFLLFFLAVSMHDPAKGMRRILAGMAVSAAVLCAFGAWEHFHPYSQVHLGNYYRLFERPPFQCQANHFAIFLMMVLSFLLAMMIRLKSGWKPWLLFASGLVVSFVMAWTYSRTAYMALGLSFATIVLLSRSLRLAAMALCLVATPLLLSPQVGQRALSIGGTLQGEGTRYNSSVKARLSQWGTLKPWIEKYPFLGTGIGSRHRVLYESFWMQLLCETGIVGLILYLGVLGLAGKILLGSFSRCSAPPAEPSVFILGFLGASAGVLFSATTLVSLVITVIAAPFWTCLGFLTRMANDPRTIA